MNTSRWLLAKIAELTVLVGFSLSVAFAPTIAGAESHNSTPVSQVTMSSPTMNPGQTAWVSVDWKSSADVYNFAVTVAAPKGYLISYPSDRAFTSLYGSSSLAAGTEDFTAFKISVPYSASSVAAIQLYVSWTKGSSSSGANGSRQSGADHLNASLQIPLLDYQGSALKQLTNSVDVSRASPAYVNVDFEGLAPSLNSFTVTVSAPNGITVTYPSNGSSSSLNGGTALFNGIPDFVAFHIDASGVSPGTYHLTLNESFNTTSNQTNTGVLDLVVS